MENQSKKVDLKMTKEEAFSMIDRYNRAYEDYRKLKKNYEDVDDGDSDSGSSKNRFHSLKFTIFVSKIGFFCSKLISNFLSR